MTNRLAPLRPIIRASLRRPCAPGAARTVRMPVALGQTAAGPRTRGFHRTAAAAGDEFGRKPTAEGEEQMGEEAEARGRTGGGAAMEKGRTPPPKPKITNSTVPGVDSRENMTKEQKEEVERHNREFDAKHDRASAAANDKVDKKFWSGNGRGTS